MARRRAWIRPTATGAVALAMCLVLAGCATGNGDSPGRDASGKLVVVAAEDFWGSIAQQLGGDHVEVTSIITNPNADPHDYEPTADDARLLASAGFVVVNGIGYDPWAERLLDANPVQGRAVLNVGDLVGVPDGGNPHQWYNPASVRRVIGAIAGAYERAMPADAGAFRALEQRFLGTGLRSYFGLISAIRSQYAGTKVGASESIFAEMAPALGLDLVTPPAFLVAVSEGTEPTAADKATIDRQISSRAISIYVANAQNTTPDVQRQLSDCRTRGIPTATITETLVPENATFQQWQVNELQGIRDALAKAAAG